ncbi:uncharacterized protein LOC144333672 [Macaca mulatta]
MYSKCVSSGSCVRFKAQVDFIPLHCWPRAETETRKAASPAERLAVGSGESRRGRYLDPRLAPDSGRLSGPGQVTELSWYRFRICKVGVWSSSETAFFQDLPRRLVGRLGTWAALARQGSLPHLLGNTSGGRRGGSRSAVTLPSSRARLTRAGGRGCCYRKSS